jgi:epsilon-lactone hydrolase
VPSFSATAISWVLRTTGIYRRMFAGGESSERAREKALSVPIQPSAKMMRSFAIARTEFQGRAVWDIAPKDRTPSATVLFWHGGGYIYPPASAHWDFFAHMAGKHAWRIVAPLYPLAPESDVSEVTGFAFDFYQHFSGTHDPASFIMAGDSAGGGLTAATAMLARDAKLALPSKLILICPWVDVVPDHPDQPAIEPRDAILTINGIREAGEYYAGPNPTSDPRVSPIHGDWSGLPPIMAFGGGDDILVTNARALKGKHPDVDYTELAGMIHDWPLFMFPESRAAQAKMAGFAAS